MTTMRLEITGRVQGVGFREAMREFALALGVTGWVRNRSDGSVEAVVQGPKEDVEQVIAWCQKGPPGAWVESVQARPFAGAETLTGFARRPSER